MSDDTSKSFQSLTDVWGDLVRRVSTAVSEVSEKVSISESDRHAIDEARRLRFLGSYAGARDILTAQIGDGSGHEYLQCALDFVAVHEILFGDPQPSSTKKIHSNAGEAPSRLLLDAARTLDNGTVPGDMKRRSYTTHDALRRARRSQDQLATFDRNEFVLLESSVAIQAHRAAGERERAIRELLKMRPRLPSHVGPPMASSMLAGGVELMLAEGRSDEAERWLRSLHRLRTSPAENPELDALERACLARIAAVQGDERGALALLEGLPVNETCWDPDRIRVALLLGHHKVARVRALRYLQARPDDPARLRLWALAEHQSWRHPAEHASIQSNANAVLDALMRALEFAPPPNRPQHLQELAHVVLNSDRLASDAATVVVESLSTTGHTQSIEARLVRAHRRLQEKNGPPHATSLETIDEDFLPGPPLHFRPEPELHSGELGPDELSPLRITKDRERVIAAHQHLAVARRALAQDDSPLARSAAVSALVQTLVEAPDLKAARDLMLRVAQPEPTPNLEALLSAATRLLAEQPGQVLGLSLDGVARALALVVAERERMARPLTIAIMGEFSSGKSTFVNALLGQAIAPMGVLPTTSTINVFRRGSGQGARVHYRDGNLATVSAGELERYLLDLDDTEANRIRYVEIERNGGRMGSTAVVDTPGLNALDPYHEQVAREFLDQADAVVWIFSATRGGTATETAILEQLRRGGRQVLGVLNKVDILEGSEQHELNNYLRKQLGDVLVDVVPLCASEALKYRCRSRSEDGSYDTEDPFAAVDRALDFHFLGKAREIKLALTRRRLREALQEARSSVEDAAAVLERRSQLADAEADLKGAREALEHFSDELEMRLLNIDDPLARECLALGLARSGKNGLSLQAQSPEDFVYLDALIEDLSLEALQTTMRSLGGGQETLLRLVESQLLPWTRGYLCAQVSQGLARSLIAVCGDHSRQGESDLRAGLRAGLETMVREICTEARKLARKLEAGVSRRQRQLQGLPAAEATRLRASVLGSIDALLEKCGNDGDLVSRNPNAHPKISARGVASTGMDGPDAS